MLFSQTVDRDEVYLSVILGGTLLVLTTQIWLIHYRATQCISYKQ